MRWILTLVAGLWLGGFAARAEPVRQDISGLAQAEIVALQRRLADAGCYKGPLDGTASPTTKTAVLACPDQRPRLVIETGMHVAAIRSIAVNNACTLAATASDDKTLRLWSLPDGQLLRTLRLAVGDGDSGKLNAAALSPDGRFVVAGGWDARFEFRRKHALTVFDASSGALLARLGEFGNVVKALEFSRDGKWLAVSLGGTKGVTLFDASGANPANWQQAGRDESYGNDSYGVSFGPDGRVYSVSLDGKLRVYAAGPQFRKISEIVTRSGKQPFSVSVDSRGERVAVGFADVAVSDIFDARTMKYLGPTEIPPLANGQLGVVTWSQDGLNLYASGDHTKNKKHVVVVFDRNGRLLSQQQTTVESTMMSMSSCRAGLAYSSFDSAFGLLDRTGGEVFSRFSAAALMEGKLGQAFGILPDGKRLRFGLKHGADAPVLFDLQRALLVEAPVAEPDLAAPRIEGLPITNWRDSRHVDFAGRSVKLDQNETSNALAIRKDGTGFVLGAEYFLRNYDGNGMQRWEKVGPAAVLGVNLSADGRIIAAAYGDGTIRWHRWSDGQELLALFVNRETKAWVAWTPTGYYSAFPGGEDLIGWHVNRGWDQAADFFPADRFRAQFARADIVERILDTLDEAEAVKLANAGRSVKLEAKPLLENLPPVISILSPAEGATIDGTSLTINYIIRSPSGLPVDAVEARVDGRPLPGVRGLGTADAMKQCLEETHGLGRLDGALQGCRGSITIEAPQNSAAIGLAARSGSRFSEAAILHVTRAASAASGSDVIKPKLYALVIGVADYVNPDYRLGFAAKDARDFAAALQHQQGGLYSDVTVQVLTDRAATIPAIKDGLDWLARATTSRDVAVFYFAGHGEIEPRSSRFYMLPAEADAKKLVSTAISREDLNIALEQMTGKTIVFLDACHSGAIAGSTLARGLGAFNVNDVVKDLANADNGIVLFAASTGKQLSLENPAWGNGAFTKALVEGLGMDGIKARADLLGKGRITLSELDAFVSERVKDLTEGAQSPVLIIPKGASNFPLALAR